MDAIPLGPGFAAELRGVTLADVACDDTAYAAARAAFEQHSVLVLRNQDVTDEIQLAFSRRFGPPEVTKVGSQGTGSHFVILSTIGPDGKVVPADHRMAMRAKANQLWHTDSSFKRLPAYCSMLHARSIPPLGGQTEFADMRAAYDALPEATQRRIAGLVAEHSIMTSRAKLGFSDFDESEREAFKPVPQVLVRRLQDSGRMSLYIASHAGTIRGMADDEAQKLLSELTEHATQRQFVYSHCWRV